MMNVNGGVRSPKACTYVLPFCELQNAGADQDSIRPVETLRWRPDFLKQSAKFEIILMLTRTLKDAQVFVNICQRIWPCVHT